jgi:large subunit ribosomal protein L19
VRRAKLYYLRGRTGKAARIREQTTGHSGKLEAAIKEEAAQAKKEKAAKA